MPEDATSALLDLDGTIWKAQQELENAEFISQAREILRDMLALLGTRLSSSPKSEAERLVNGASSSKLFTAVHWTDIFCIDDDPMDIIV